jgi:[protein-PII] uridylyltransferase
MHRQLQDHSPGGIPWGQVEAHFQGMPPHYWDRITLEELCWGLQTVQAFSRKRAAAESIGNPVVADWRHVADRSSIQLMVCATDRPGLVAKIAASCSVLRIPILRADVYTRADHLALDLFELGEIDRGRLPSATQLQHLAFLLEGALSEPPRFVSVWASQFHRALPQHSPPEFRVHFDNTNSADSTIIRVESTDRLGLLYDLFQVLTDARLNISQARIDTQNGVAQDLFHVTDLEGRKITEPVAREALRQALVEVLR